MSASNEGEIKQSAIKADEWVAGETRKRKVEEEEATGEGSTPEKHQKQEESKEWLEEVQKVTEGTAPKSVEEAEKKKEVPKDEPEDDDDEIIVVAVVRAKGTRLSLWE